MTIASSARKIIKTQRFIFRALPAVLASMFILTACVGSITVPTTISNPNTQSFCEANPFRHSCNQAASETARKRIIEQCEAGQASNLCGDATAYSCYLNPENPQCDAVVQKSCDANPFKQQCAQGEFESARENIITECTTDRSGNLCGEATGYSCYLNPNGALCEQSASKDGLQEDTVNTNTNNEIASLKDDLQKANTAKTTADNDITRLKNELATAISERDSAKNERDSATGDKDTANLRITELEGKLQTAEGERDTAKSRITTLEGELSTAIGERDTANGTITTLQGQLQTATGERDTANGRITDLEGELSTAKGERDTAIGERDTVIGERDTAIDERNTARGRITTLEGQLSTATGERDTAKDRITELEGQLSTAISERDAETGDKTTANLRITELEGQLSTATEERDTANGMITTLQGELSTAEDERDTANGKVTTLEGQLSTATGALSTANGKVLDLEGQLSTVTGERDTARDKVTDLEGELSTAKGERDTARGKVTELEGELQTATEERDTANGMITTLQGQLSTATGALSTARGKVTELEGQLSTATGALSTANGMITTLQGQLSTATEERDTARGMITTLQGQLQTAINERDTAIGERDTVIGERDTAIDERNTARGRITTLEGQLSTATGERDTAKDRITELEGQLSTAISERDAETGDKTTANLRITELEGQLSTAIDERDTARGTITTLQGELSTAKDERDTANGKVTTLQGQLETAQGALSTANGKVLDLEGQLSTVTGERDTARDKVTDLEGKLETATTDKNTVDAEVIRLTEDLRLAEEARLKEIRDNHHATYNNWVNTTGPDATADTENPRNQFLQTTDGRLDTTGFTLCADSNSAFYCGPSGRTPAFASTRNLNTAEFDGRDINGDINDGYAYFSGYIGETQYSYYGILDSTDLGAPLTGDAGTSVEWNGVFFVADRSGTDFTLTITFESAGGRLDAFFNGTNNRFWRLQNARFDTGGVITGTVNYQGFTDSDPTKPIDSATDGDSFTGDSVLSGIIGQEGAVAVFAGARFGGFFAGPDITPNPDVRLSDWRRGVGDIHDPVTSVPRNQFLVHPSVFSLNNIHANSDGNGYVAVQTLRVRDARFNGNPLGGRNAYDQIAFFNGYIGGTRHYYSGNGSANLGATLPVWQTGQPTSAIWRGQFSVLQGANAVANENLTLEVNYQNRRLTAFVPVGANHYLLDAGFNISDNGFFAGTVNFGAFTDTTNRTSTNTLTPGVLTGLIGVEGAYGAFVSGSTTDNGRTITGGEGENGFAGGFVVDPTVPEPPPVVNFADWAGAAGNAKTTVINSAGTGRLPLLNGAASVDYNNPFGNFVQGLATLTGKGFNFAGTPFADATVLGDVLLLEADSPSGVAFSNVTGHSQGYAGLLPGTTLGAPITDINTNAIWDAKFAGATIDFDSGFQIVYSNPDFKMQVTFNGSTAGTINSGTVSNGVFTAGQIRAIFTLSGSSNSDDFNIQGKFGSDSLLYGTVSHLLYGTVNSYPLTGLIGVDGAVGAFVDSSDGNFGFAGGFVAVPSPLPDANPNIVNYADWTRRTTVKNADGTHGIVPLLNGATRVADTNPIANFIHGLATVDDKGFNFVGTGFPSASVVGDVLLLKADSPSGVAFSRVSGTDVTGDKVYAGLLPATTLGAPITDINTDAIWDAKFDAIYVSGGNVSRYSSDSQMRVTFNNSGGTINFGTVSGNTFTPGDISVPYTDGGSGGSNDFDIQGKFGRDGLLYGKVRGRAARATLTGLIGVDGAVGAFVTGNNNFGFAGGFVAHPTNTFENVVVAPPIVDFADWAGAAGNPKTTVINRLGTGTPRPLLNGAASVDDTNPVENFVQGLATLTGKGFNFAGTGFPSANVVGDVLLLEAGSPSGVAFSNVNGTGVTDDKGYAGLLPGTNLGAPITDINTSAIWEAKLQAISVDFREVSRWSNPDFKMRVTFDGRTGEINSGTVSNSGVFTAGVISTQITRNGSFYGSNSFNIQGQFGSDGLLYGTVGFYSTPVTLTGLIGSGGAVGAFVDNYGRYAGGFVAAPSLPPQVDFFDWAGLPRAPKPDVIDSAGTGTVPLLNGVASVSISNPVENYVQGLPTLTGKGFNFAGTAFPDATVRGGILLLEAGSPSGIAFSAITGIGGTGAKGYAGLLPTTNLGAPITDINTSAIWDAKLEAIFVNSGSSVFRYSPTDFKMRVTFDGSAGEINSGTVSNGVFTAEGIVVPVILNGNSSGSFNFNIQGRFGRDGLLYGTVSLGFLSRTGPLTGLIGSGGAVGAFVDSFGLAGGFVAKPQ